MYISDLSIRRPVMTTVMTLALLFFGIITFLGLGMDLFPRMELPFVSVVTTLKGASPEVMESDVTDVIEEEVSTIQGVKHITSTSSEGVSQVFIEFFLERDIEEGAQDVRDKVAQAVRRLPVDTDPPVVVKLDIESQAILWIAITGKWSRREMSRLADKVLKPRFETLPGVGRVWVGGFQDREVRVWLDAEKLEAYNLSALDVVEALRRENVELPGGRIEGKNREFVVRTMGEFETAQAFNSLIVAFRDGSPIKLRDIGYAEDGVQDLRSYVRYQGKPAVGLGIQKQSGANTVEVADRVKKRLEEVRGLIPPELQVGASWDISAHIKRSIKDLELTLLYGSILASLVIFLFLRSFRPSLVCIISIPTSLIATFSIMSVFGFTLNNMTLLGLALSAGLVCDDAIIVVENIYRHLDRGADPMKAAREGTAEIAFAAAAATFSIMAVFTPVAFVHGIMARFFKEFAITIAGAVFISLFIALTLIPMLSSRWMKKEEGTGRFYQLLDKSYAFLEGKYREVLAMALRHRILTVILAIAVTAISFNFWKMAKKEFIPLEDRSEFVIFYELPVGSSLSFIESLARRAEDFISRMPETKSVLNIIGFGERGEVHKGIFLVRLVERGKRKRSQMELMDYLRQALKEFPGFEFSVSELTPMGVGGGMGKSTRLMVLISGPRLEDLSNYAEKITAKLKATPGFVDVDHNIELIKPEVKVYINREKAADLGVDIASIASIINYLIGGDDVSKFKAEGERYDVRVRLITAHRQAPQDITRLMVRNKQGGLIKLSNFVELREELGPNLINRRDRQRAVIIYSNLQGKAMEEAMEEIIKITKPLLGMGYTMNFVGPAEAMIEFFQNVFLALGLSVVVIYLVLAAQFESFAHPFSIMLTLPLSGIGALGALWLTGKSLSITSLIGILMLTGLVTKNAILLVDYTNTLRSRGMSRDDAILEAAPVRLRPILMTAITTILGILPVALEMGAGAEARSPMGIAVVGGMLSSTALTLFVIPVVYSLLDDLGRRFVTTQVDRLKVEDC